MKYDYLIVGTGFAGSVCAERLAVAGKRVLVIDKRSHIGGNAHDCLDEHGVMIHPYGPHIFHTNSKRIFEYLSGFTDWRFYEHRVLAQVDGELYSIPINRTTINRLYRKNLDEKGIVDFLDSVRLPRDKLLTSEDVVLSSVGADLCEKFFRGYTRKQWALDLSELSAGVAARIPTRSDDDDRYFSDSFQFMPAAGYTAMFARMLRHPNIEIRLSADYFDVKASESYERLIFTGPIDAYFDYRYGRLPYRSLRFEHEHLRSCGRFQATGTVNYPNDFEFTRITEFKHLTGQEHPGTSIVREYPMSDGDPYYPIPTTQNEKIFQSYKALANTEHGVYFVGRLAQYRYYNMDQVVGSALSTVKKILADDLPDIATTL